jgi:muramoyltetrapeptide carboxypeptidase
VAIVFPSGPPAEGQLERSLDLVRGWGLEPVVGPHATAGHPRAPYLSATDADRAADLQWAWRDPAIDAVFCARGGYGSVRLLDLLDADALRRARPKPIFGSSDATALAEYWLDRLDTGFWFAPMLATGALLDDEAAIRGLKAAIFEAADGRGFDSPAASSIVEGTASGRLIGGNLALLAMTTGARSTPSADHSGAIALLEDVTEPVYRIDAMLTTLLRAGWFDGVAGIALGSWTDGGPLGEIRALAEELLGPLGVPLVWELGFGHGPAAHSIPLGARATLTADDRPRLVLEDE